MYFALAAWPGLQSGFSPDDLMNLTFAVRDGWGKILRGNILFFSTQYRPLGQLYYLSLYDLFGMNSLPFRVVGIGLLALNMGLLFRLVRLLTGSVEAGLYAAPIIAWHGNFAPLFLGSGNIYDVLGFTFYVGTLGFYASARARELLTPRGLAALAALQICALNSKEFAATIPVLLLVFELLYYLRSPDRRAVALSVVLSGVYTAGKLLGADSLTGQSAYRPRLSLQAYVDSMIPLQNDFLYKSEGASIVTVVWFVIVFVGLGLLLRNRAMLLGCALTLLAPLPVMLIAPRGLAAHYLTIGGFALWTGALLADVRERFSNSIRTSDREYRYLQNAMFVGLLLLMVRTHVGEIAYQNNHFWTFARPIAQSVESMKQHPEWWSNPDTRVLVVSDPFPADDWATVFIAKLVSHRPELQVFDLSKLQPQPSADELQAYELYLHWDGRQFVVGSAPGAGSP